MSRPSWCETATAESVPPRDEAATRPASSSRGGRLVSPVCDRQHRAAPRVLRELASTMAEDILMTAGHRTRASRSPDLSEAPKPVRFAGPRYVGPSTLEASRTPLQLLLIPYLGQSKIDRLARYGVHTVEELARLDPTDRHLAMNVTKNSRPDLAVRTLAKWRAKAQRFLLDKADA